MLTVQSEVKLNPQKYCWICSNPSSGNDKYSLSPAFRMLLRFMKIEQGILSCVQHTSSEKDGIYLCADCEEKVNSFWNVYQDFETIRLYMDEFVYGLCELIKKKEYEEHESDSLAEQLRKETIKRCEFKMKSTPRVHLGKMIILLDGGGDGSQGSEGQERGDKLPSQDDINTKSNIKPPPPSMLLKRKLSPSYRNSDTRFSSVNRIVLKHIKELYPNQIPSRTTQLELHDATSLTIGGHLRHPDNLNATGGIKCTTCSKHFTRRSSFRVHILRSHLNEVVTTLQNQAAATSVPCDYCEHTARDSFNMITHMTQLHTLQFYSSQIPPGTTELQINDAISMTIDKHLAHPDNQDTSKDKVKCATCSKPFSQRGPLRTHILRSHFNEVIQTFEEPEPQPPPMAPVEEEQQSEWGFEGIAEVGEVDLMDIKLEPIPLTSEEIQDLSSQLENLPIDPPTQSSDQELHEQSSPIVESIRILNTESWATQRTKVAKLYTCFVCRKSFETYAKLCLHKKSHSRSKRSKKLSNHNCHFCPKEFTSGRDVRYHLLSIHPMEIYAEMIPPGTTCAELKIAIRWVVAKAKKYPSGEILCPFCDRYYSRQASHRLHILGHHFNHIILALNNPQAFERKEPKQFKCDLCDKIFLQKCALRNHLVVHSDVRNYKCSNCSSCFKTDVNLRTHSIRLHAWTVLKEILPPKTTEVQLEETILKIIAESATGTARRQGYKYSCKLCQRFFSKRSVLRMHLFTVHLATVIHRLNSKKPSPSQTESIAKFGKSLLSKKQLPCKRAREYPNANPIPCDYCKLTFKWRNDRKSHIMLQHTFLFYGNLLPSGTTESGLESAIEKVMEEKIALQKGNTVSDCSRCLKPFRKPYPLKCHVIRVHFNEVVALLK